MLNRLKGMAAKVAEGVASMQEAQAALMAEHESARAEWGDGGTRRPGWTSALATNVSVGGAGSAPALREDAVSEAEVAQLHAWTEHLRGVLATGAPGTAIVHAADDTGERLARHAFATLDLTLQPDGGGAERRLTVRLPVCGTDLKPWRDPDPRPVRFDSADPSRMAFLWQGNRRSNLHRGHVKVSGWGGAQRIDLVGLLPGRGLLDGVSAMLAPGEVSNMVETDMYVRLRTPGGLGPRITCGHHLDWKPAKLLEPGADVPVAVDPVSGELEDVITAALTDEMRPRFGEVSALDQMFVEPLRDIGYQARAVAEVARDVTSKEFWQSAKLPDDGGFAPGDPILAPVAGVTFEHWVAVSAGMGRDKVAPDQRDAYAQGYGLAPGAWAEGEREWQRRRIGHPMMAQRFGVAFERALKGR